MKYAFIMNSGTLNPDNYSKLHADRQNEYYFVAVHGMKMAEELAKKLTEDGYDFIDLCGDFNEEKLERIRKAIGGQVVLNRAKYTDEDQKKFDAMSASDKYGIIVLGFDQMKETVRFTLESGEYNTYIAIVDKEENAAKKATEMVREGIHFIELCGYFDEKKAAAVSEACGHKIPIGYCGK